LSDYCGPAEAVPLLQSPLPIELFRYQRGQDFPG
jgi:hypothetical protein